KPCRQPGATAKFADVAIGFQVGVLERVFGLGIVLENRAGDAKELAVVLPHHGFESGLIVASDTRRKLAVVDYRGAPRVGWRGSGLNGHGVVVVPGSIG